MGSPNEPTTGKAILEKLVKNKKDGAGKKRVVSNAKTFQNLLLLKKDLIKDFLERVISEKLDIGTNKLVNNFHLYCDELDKAARDPKLKGYTKKDVIQLIHQIIKDNVLDRIQNRELKEISEV